MDAMQGSTYLRKWPHKKKKKS